MPRRMLKTAVIAAVTTVAYVVACPLLYLLQKRCAIKSGGSYLYVWDIIVDNTPLKKPLLGLADLVGVGSDFKTSHLVRCYLSNTNGGKDVEDRLPTWALDRRSGGTTEKASPTVPVGQVSPQAVRIKR